MQRGSKCPIWHRHSTGGSLPSRAISADEQRFHRLSTRDRPTWRWRIPSPPDCPQRLPPPWVKGRRHPRLKRSVILMMRAKSCGKSLRHDSSTPCKSPWCSPSISIKSSGCAICQARMKCALARSVSCYIHPNYSHQVQENLRHRIAPLLHRQGVFGHAHAAPVIALKVGAMRQRIRRKQA